MATTPEQLVLIAVRNLGSPRVEDIARFMPSLSLSEVREAVLHLHDRSLVKIDPEQRVHLLERI